MKRHPRRSVPATLTALVLLAACALVAVVTIQMLLGETPWIRYDTVAAALHGTRWTDTVTAIVGAAAVLLGLILVLAAIIPGKPVVLPLRGDLDSGASRRSYRSTLRVAASAVDGVSDARVKLKPRTIAATVTTGRTTIDGLADAVRRSVEERLDQIDPAVRPTVRVKIRAVRKAS
ncbi:DUF6286 domain-containing protein [Amycolatopsis sp. NPDC089917]|uniref:DUF6286 domain-containing protein n=1 Tax=Amycolatopsis sp. NPDC089917 TaxID=3155187 RepID=UPI00343137AA